MSRRDFIVCMFLLMMKCASAQTWVQLNPANSPGAVSGHGVVMAYDAARGETILYISSTSSTWRWDGSNWTQLSPPSSPPVLGGKVGLVYDSTRQEIVLYGGITSANASAVPQTWVWNGSTWANKTPAPPLPSPTATEEFGIAFDAARGKVVLFGGYQVLPGFAGVPVTETWEWDGSNWSTATPQAGSASPSFRVNPNMVYDAAHGNVVLYGGCLPSSNDTWIWNGSWSNPQPASPNNTAPLGVCGGAIEYDAIRQEVLFFGGNTGYGTVFNSTWAWSGSGWSTVNTTNPPPPRSAPGVAYDISRSQLVIFGGQGIGTVFGDTWVLSSPNETLQLICRPLEPSSNPVYGSAVPLIARHCYFLATDAFGNQSTYGAYCALRSGKSCDNGQGGLLTPAKNGDLLNGKPLIPNGCTGGLGIPLATECVSIPIPRTQSFMHIVQGLEQAVAAGPQGGYDVVTNNCNVWVQEQIDAQHLAVTLPTDVVASQADLCRLLGYFENILLNDGGFLDPSKVILYYLGGASGLPSTIIVTVCAIVLCLSSPGLRMREKFLCM